MENASYCAADPDLLVGDDTLCGDHCGEAQQTAGETQCECEYSAGKYSAQKYSADEYHQRVGGFEVDRCAFVVGGEKEYKERDGVGEAKFCARDWDG